jgi:uncharacterized membrane protein YedE/YeeE
MTNPFTKKSWSPYLVGAGIGLLSWFAFATADKHLAITLQYEHVAALAGKVFVPDGERVNTYYTVRAQQGLSPRIGWYMMLIVGVFVGGFLSSWLSRDRTDMTVPPLWHWGFGSTPWIRLAFAFIGAAVMVFGARLAGGCTSGHGISGTLQLAVSSWVFISLAFAVAIAAAFIMYGKEGRNHV